MQPNQFSWKGMKICLKGTIFIAIAIIVVFVDNYIDNNTFIKILNIVAILSVLTGTIIIFIGLKKHKNEMFHR